MHKLLFFLIFAMGFLIGKEDDSYEELIDLEIQHYINNNTPHINNNTPLITEEHFQQKKIGQQNTLLVKQEEVDYDILEQQFPENNNRIRKNSNFDYEPKHNNTQFTQSTQFINQDQIINQDQNLANQFVHAFTTKELLFMECNKITEVIESIIEKLQKTEDELSKLKKIFDPRSGQPMFKDSSRNSSRESLIDQYSKFQQEVSIKFELLCCNMHWCAVMLGQLSGYTPSIVHSALCEAIINLPKRAEKLISSPQLSFQQTQKK